MLFNGVGISYLPFSLIRWTRKFRHCKDFQLRRFNTPLTPAPCQYEESFSMFIFIPFYFYNGNPHSNKTVSWYWGIGIFVSHMFCLVGSMLRSTRCGFHGPLARYVKLRVAHPPEMPGTFPLPPQVSDPDLHHGMCVTHVPWCRSGSLTSGFLWSRWRGKRSRHSRRMRNPQFAYLVRGPCCPRPTNPRIFTKPRYVKSRWTDDF